MENTLNEKQIKELLDHFEDNIVVSDDENELTLYRTKDWGDGEKFLIQFNSKFVHDSKRIGTAVRNFNLYIEKYNLSTETLLEAFREQTATKP